MSISLKRDVLEGVRVLVAEDDDMVARIMTVILSRAGAEVARAADGPQAVEMASKGEFDVALLDLEMPRYGGVEATREIVDLPNPPACIALTGSQRDEDRQRCENAGMVGYL
ncbi:response regulator, partial [bacterium]